MNILSSREIYNDKVSIDIKKALVRDTTCDVESRAYLFPEMYGS